MSASDPTMLTLTTENLSADGARVTPDEGKANVPVTEAAALAVLQAFARLSAMDLVDVDAKIYLTGPRGKIAVQNVGGKLFSARVPESVNPAAEHTPEETIALLTAGDPLIASTAAVAEAAQEAEIIAEAARLPAGPRDWMNSLWVLGGVLIAFAIVAYVGFTSETPEGVQIIRDPARVASLHTEFNGRYGAPAATTLVLNHGKLTGQQAAAAGKVEEQIFALNYRFGLDGERVVIVVDNGALLEPQPDGSLKYLDSVYPRQSRP